MARFAARKASATAYVARSSRVSVPLAVAARLAPSSHEGDDQHLDAERHCEQTGATEPDAGERAEPPAGERDRYEGEGDEGDEEHGAPFGRIHRQGRRAT